MHLLRHRYTYSSVNSCPALRNKKPYLHSVFPRVAYAYTWSHRVQWFLFLVRTANVYRSNSISLALWVLVPEGSWMVTQRKIPEGSWMVTQRKIPEGGWMVTLYNAAGSYAFHCGRVMCGRIVNTRKKLDIDSNEIPGWDSCSIPILLGYKILLYYTYTILARSLDLTIPIQSN